MSGVQPGADGGGSSGGASSAGGGGWKAWDGNGWNRRRGSKRGGAWRGNDDWQHAGDGGQAAGDGGQAAGAAGDGQEAGGAGPPVPVEFVLTGQNVWQTAMGDEWLDVDPTWTEPLIEAMRKGTRWIRLEHTYQNKYGENVNSWYTIDCADPTAVMQQNGATGKRRKMRLVQLMAPSVVQLPPPSKRSAHQAGVEPSPPGADQANAANMTM